MVARCSKEGTEPNAAPNLRSDECSPGHLLPLYDAVTEQLIRFVRRTRRRRGEYLNPDLFGEPAWEILLDLYAAELSQRRRPITSLCLENGISVTSGLRWLQTLENESLVKRSPDPHDRRRVFVSLTDDAIARMDGLFAIMDDELDASQLRRTER